MNDENRPTSSVAVGTTTATVLASAFAMAALPAGGATVGSTLNNSSRDSACAAAGLRDPSPTSFAGSMSSLGANGEKSLDEILMELRTAAIADGMSLMTLDEIKDELALDRGESRI